MRARTIVIGMVVLVLVLVGIAVYSGHVASIHTAGGAPPSAEAPVPGRGRAGNRRGRAGPLAGRAGRRDSRGK